MKKVKIISCFLTVILLLACTVLTVFAEGEYSVPSADFSVIINEDGSADITETWTLNYKSGNFSRFYKDIMNTAYDEGSLDTSSIKVAIDGTPCDVTDDVSNRPDYHFSTGYENGYFRINAYLATGEGTHIYEFSYHLGTAVKKSDDTYHFETRLIGAHFSENVDSVTVSFTVPEGVNILNTSNVPGTFSINANQAMAASNFSVSSNAFYVHLAMDSPDEAIFAGVSENSVNESNASDTDNSSVATVIVSSLLFLLLLLPLLVSAVFELNYKKYAKLIDADATNSKSAKKKNKLKKLFSDLRHIKASPIEVAASLSDTNGLFMMAVLAKMMREGYIFFSEDKQFVFFRECPNLANYCTYLINILEKLNKMQLNEERAKGFNTLPNINAGWSAVSYWYIEKYILSNTNITKDFLSFAKSAGNELIKSNDSFKKSIRFLEKVFSYYSTNYPFEQLLNDLNGTADDILCYCRFFNSAPTKKNKNIDNNNIYCRMALMCCSTYEKYKATARSSDSGCSGCSSCSSCGGGGAD